MTELPIRDDVIYQEMMVHPALFMHSHPKKIAIIGDEQCGVLKEILHHPEVDSVDHVDSKQARLIHHDERITLYKESVSEWIKNKLPESLDIIIIASDEPMPAMAAFFNLLHPDGILVHQGDSPFKINSLKNLQQKITASGFEDLHFLIYSQPNFPAGLRTALLAKKHGNFRKIREKDIFNKTFKTHYYNFDIHQAALVLPEFMRHELQPI